MKTNKPLVQSPHQGVDMFIASMSKAALGDLVIHLIRKVENNEHLDGADLIKKLRETFEPIARAREDRVANLRQFKVMINGSMCWGWTDKKTLPTAYKDLGATWVDP